MPRPTSAASPRFEIVDRAVLVAGGDAMIGTKPKWNDDAFRHRVSLPHLGVRLADGTAPALSALLYRHRRPVPPDLSALPERPVRHPGLFIFGGVAGPQFGHLLTQSIGRLWAASLHPEAPILFLAETLGMEQLPGAFVAFLRSLGVRNELRLVTSSMECETLLIPGELCNLESRPCLRPEFKQWLTTVIRYPDTSGQGDLYVSRSGLDPSMGQYLQEATLEAALQANGYRVFHPETHTIEEQIATYRAARRVIFADGSAMHLWSFVAHPGQRSAVILRRDKDRHFAAWLRSIQCGLPVYINQVLAAFSRRGEGPARSVVLLDLGAVWQQLGEFGFHQDSSAIGATRSEVFAWANSLAAKSRAFPAPPFGLDQRSLDLIARRNRFSVLAPSTAV